MTSACKLTLLITLAVAGAAAAAPVVPGPPVGFAVLASDAAIFYPTRALRKGDRFEINARHLHQHNRLMVVPCLPNCLQPTFVYARPLNFGIQHLVIPISARYVFWLERDQIGGPGIPYRHGWTRLPLPVLAQQATAEHFVAQFDRGTELTLRALFVQAAAETADRPDAVSARSLVLTRPVTRLPL
jgi:hypothetical protein